MTEQGSKAQDMRLLPVLFLFHRNCVPDEKEQDEKEAADGAGI